MKPYYCLLLALLFLSACRPTPGEGLSWDVEGLAPLAFADLGIPDVVPDTSLLASDPDGLLRLRFRDTIASQTLGEYISFPDTNVSLSVKLDTLSLSSDTISQSVTLAELARQLIAQGNVLGNILLSNHGGTIPFLPPTSGLSSGLIEVDASDFFEFAELKSGSLILTINNQLPVNLANVVFEINNAALGGPPLLRDTFALIPKFSNASRSYDLAGKQVESALAAQMVNLDILQDLFVPIDTTDFIRISLQANDLQARTATAVFPAQTVLDTLRQTEYAFPDTYGAVEITRLKIRSGKIRAQTISTVEDTLLFSYRLPTALGAQGEVPEVSIKLLPAPPGGTITETREISLDNFTLDLAQGSRGYNTLLEAIRVDLVYSGRLVTLDETDSVRVSFGLVEVELTYVEGYIGQQRFSLQGSQAIDFFSEIEAEKLALSEASASVLFSNSVGVDAEVELRDFNAVNSRDGRRVKLSGAPLLAGPFRIPGAALPDTSLPRQTLLALSPANSNIVPFINSLPDRIDYDIQVLANPSRQPGQRDNFATDQSRIEAFLEFEAPLIGVAQRLLLRDTAALSLGSTDAPDEISGGELRLLIENRFPVEAEIDAKVLDASGALVAQLASGSRVAAGQPDASGYVAQPATSQIAFAFDAATLQRILREGQRIAFEARVDTRPAGQAARIYQEYRIKLKLVGAFTYRIEN
jgi:hypothetical protein